MKAELRIIVSESNSNHACISFSNNTASEHKGISEFSYV